MRRLLCLLLCLATALSLTAGCAAEETAGVFDGGTFEVRAAVLCAPGCEDRMLSDYLAQSTLLGLTAETVEADAALELDGFDVLYLSPTLLTAETGDLAEKIMQYTQDGGWVFAENAFYDFFPAEYFGAASFKKVEGCCAQKLRFPRAGEDLRPLQELVEDFAGLYTSYYDYDVLSEQDYGWGMKPDTAVPLVKWKGLSIYAVNSYGDGRVLFTNPLLPNRYSGGAFDMKSTPDSAAPFANTTASFNQLLVNAFAECAAKARYGYALERVFGYFGSPSMSWELHYEELSGMENDSMGKFSELCREYLQVPSYALVRNPYLWFLRAESVCFWLNETQGGGFEFGMDFYENAYSSGTHVAAGDEWLSQVRETDAGSYFVDYPEDYTCRACPAVLDYDGDGNADIFCGSKDGYIYYYRGAGFADGRLKTEAAVKVTDGGGADISLESFSAPCLYDLDGDGFDDLICGRGDGVISWYRGDGTLSFRPMGTLLDTDFPGQALPAAADMNGDGTVDLVVGSDKGILMIYFGERPGDGGAPRFSALEAVSLSGQCADAELGHWLAPACADWNGDGETDLLLGVYQGYVAVMTADGAGGFNAPEYVSVGEGNYKGNDYLKYGNYCAPALWDIDGDGKTDLICGGQEYGLAYPIDSEYFPCRDELRRQLDYAREQGYYVGVHYLTNAFASARRESYELEAHKKAMEFYGLDTDTLGVNHHTWYISSLSDTQTMECIAGAGLLWQSGFAPSEAADHPPQAAAENVVALPFFMTGEGGEERLLIQNNSVLPYTSDEWYALSAKYRMPVCVYYHCDFVYNSDEDARKTLGELDSFRRENAYNFNREDQMMKASAAVYHQRVDASGELLGGGISIAPAAVDTDFALYDENVQRSLGVRVAFAQGIDEKSFDVDADVWFAEQGAIVVGLNRPVSITPVGKREKSAHISRINMAAETELSDTGAEIRFLDGGMMQAAVSGKATCAGEGWTVTEEKGGTLFTKFGGGETLVLEFEQ